jgi:hypothetical protein
MPSFSVRYETRRPTEGLVVEAIPQRVRNGLVNLLFRIAPDERDEWESLGSTLHYRLDLDPYAEKNPSQILHGLNWDEWCDACEFIWRWFRDSDRNDLADQFSNELNELFLRNYFGYEMRNGALEVIGARAQDEAVAMARGILRDVSLKGPDEQFQKAIAFYNRRPEPDCENCVKEAVSAVEGVARILLEDHSLTLSDALKRLRSDKDIHPTLIQMLEKLYAYRGDAEGVGHALTGEKEVRIEEAEFVLGTSASAVVYLARLYGRAVE